MSVVVKPNLMLSITKDNALAGRISSAEAAMTFLRSTRLFAAPCLAARSLHEACISWVPAADRILDACRRQPATPSEFVARLGTAQCTQLSSNTEATTSGRPVPSGGADKVAGSQESLRLGALGQWHLPSVVLASFHAQGSLPVQPMSLRQWRWVSQPVHTPCTAHQLQAARGLLGAKVKSKPVNWQDHNKKKPKRIKLKTPSVAKRRFIVDKDGIMWRMQQGRRHNRSNKRSGRLHALKGLVPLAPYAAAKLRKLGFKRRWWYSEKS